MTKVIPRKTWRTVLFIILIAVILYFLFRVRVVLPTFLLAGFMAYLLNPIVEYLEKRNLSRVYAILFIYSTVILAIILLSLMVFPKVIKELNAFAEAIPEYTAQARQFILDIQADYARVEMPESVREAIDETVGQIENQLVNLISQFAQGLINLFAQIFYIIISPVLAFYILKDWESLERRFYRALPLKIRTEVSNLLLEIHLVLRKFIRGHLIVAAIVGMLTAAGLGLLGMEFALILGIIAGISDLIPYFGPIIGAVPAVILGLLESSRMALYVIIVMLIVQQLETNLISPKILGDSLGIHPLTIIFVVLAGGHLFGVIGMLLAVPFTAIFRIILLQIHEYLVD